ncbi:DUF4340 domain-containing protein [Pleionea sediminis]|uniref:DUF4340 domain-containing protein n=1 Tax=Pleionea sediminis TaxID=2569479 RepID=UPI0011851EC1|nr:DUF4340 domain-containing protein [Pleionea sediminis]
MNRLIHWLVGLLIVQAIVVLSLLWGEQSKGDSFQVEPLLKVSKESIDKLVITDGEASVTLKKVDDHWVLPEWKSLPANDNKLSVALNKLASLKTDWPVTTTNHSHERFKVTEEVYQRRLELYSGDEKVGDLFLGSSPGFKKVHVRPGNRDEVYALPLNSYEFPSDKKQWLDKSLLALKGVTSLKIKDIKLQQNGEEWELVEPNQSELAAHLNKDKSASSKLGKEPVETPLTNDWKLNKEEVERLVRTIENLSVLSVAEEDISFDKAVEVNVVNEQPYQFQFVEKDGTYYVKRSDNELVFQTNSMAQTTLTEAKVSDLIASNEELAEESINKGNEFSTERKHSEASAQSTSSERHSQKDTEKSLQP